MRPSSGRQGERNDVNVPDTEREEFRWDWVAVLVVLVIAVIFVLLTFDLWTGGSGPHA